MWVKNMIKIRKREIANKSAFAHYTHTHTQISTLQKGGEKQQKKKQTTIYCEQCTDETLEFCGMIWRGVCMEQQRRKNECAAINDSHRIAFVLNHYSFFFLGGTGFGT